MHDIQKAKQTIIENAVKLPFHDLLLINSQISEHLFNLYQQAQINAEVQKQEAREPDDPTVLN